MRASSSQNHGWMPDSAASAADDSPARMRPSRASRRSHFGIRMSPSLRAVPSSSRERSVLPIASQKLRPMPIASPTDFICVVRVPSAPGNFSKAKRGALTTT